MHRPILLSCLFVFLLASVDAHTQRVVQYRSSRMVTDPLPGCDVYRDNQCSGNNVVTPPEFEKRRWFTPRRGDDDWESGFQDFAYLSGHAHVVYDSSRTSATVSVLVDTLYNVNLKYKFNNEEQSSNTKVYGKETKVPVVISVTTSDNKTITLEPIDFIWNAAPIASRPGDYRNGQKGAIVELFGWSHADVELECKRMASLGYLGVKLFPVQETVMSFEPFSNVMNPWYFYYQPLSYKLEGRAGSRDDLRRLVNTCRSYGVRVYADAVINHMVGSGNDANTRHRNPGAGCAYWADKNSTMSIRGKSKSPFYTQGFQYTQNPYTGLPSSQEFPAAHLGPQDFHCERSLNSWTDPLCLNAGWLSGLVDINTERDNVQERIADFLTDLIGIGFSGFRVDAAKHIHPDSLVKIYSKLRRNLGGQFPDDFISWLEVLLGGEAQLLMCNDDSGYNYGRRFEQTLLAAGITTTDVNKIKIWHSGYPKEVDVDCNTISRVRNVIQNDDHDQQNPGSSSRDMGDCGCVLVKAEGNGCDIDKHRGYEVKMFSSPYGTGDNDNMFPIRLILSSFYFGSNGAMGIPDGFSDCKYCVKNCNTCNGMPYTKAYDDSSCGYDKSVFTRVHRDKQIVNAMRAWIHLDPISNYC